MTSGVLTPVGEEKEGKDWQMELSLLLLVLCTKDSGVLVAIELFLRTLR